MDPMGKQNQDTWPSSSIFLEVVPFFWRLNHIRLITTVLESWEVLSCCRKVSSDRSKFFYVVGTAACIPKTRYLSKIKL